MKNRRHFPNWPFNSRLTQHSTMMPNLSPMKQIATGLHGRRFATDTMEARSRPRTAYFSSGAAVHDDWEYAGVIDGNQRSDEKSSGIGDDYESQGS
jgi:pectin methylesterase-like acyl-CoA thioesterase